MRLSTGWILITCLAFASGCGSGENSLHGARNQPNDFSGNSNPSEDFSSGSTGDSGNSAGLDSNQLRVTLELPAGLAPEGEPTRRGLHRVTPERIRVYRTNPALQNLGAVSVSTTTDSNGATIITFADGLPSGPDIIIEASYGNLLVQAPAAVADQDVKINPFSDYLVRNTLPGYSTSEFQNILDCVSNTRDEPCPNRYVWPALDDQVQDFEIDIPATASLEEARQLLAGRGDFSRYVSAMAGYAIPDSAPGDDIRASSADYNAVFMGVELGQSFMESALEGAGQWGVRIAREETATDSNGTSTIWPGLTLASLEAFGIEMTALSSDIPYGRETLIHASGDRFFPRDSGNWQTNSHASAPAAASRISGVRLRSGRSMYQSITGQDSARILGWTRNPWFMDAWTSPQEAETSPVQQVITGYFSAGKAIDLEADGDQYRRGDLAETHYLSALELDLIRQPGFTLETLDGGQYHALYLAIRFGTDTPMVIETGLGDWQITGDSLSQTRSTTTLSRSADGSVDIAESAGLTDTWGLSAGTPDSGRVFVDMIGNSGTPQHDPSMGAAAPEGGLLAFNLDDSPVGDGMLIALPRTTTAAPDSGQYRVQGFALGLSREANQLQHFDNATLIIRSDASATLYPRTLEVSHRVPEETVSVPVFRDGEPLELSYTHTGNGRVLFTNGNLRLEGFTGGAASPFYLRLQNTGPDQKQLGLLVMTPLP